MATRSRHKKDFCFLLIELLPDIQLIASRLQTMRPCAQCLPEVCEVGIVWQDE